MNRAANVSAVMLLGAIVSGCSLVNRHARATTTIEQSNKSLVRRYYEEIISTGDVDALPEIVSPDYVEVHEGVMYELGLEGAMEHIVGVRTTYADLTLTIERQIAEGEWVTSMVTARGTHRGVWMNMTPTNKPVRITAVNVDRVVNGRIVEHGGAANLLRPLMEIGAIKVADPVDESH